MPHSMSIPDAFWVDAQERYDMKDPSPRLKELLYKVFYTDYNVYKMTKEQPEMFTNNSTPNKNNSNGNGQYSTKPFNWTEAFQNARGFDRGVLMHAKYGTKCYQCKGAINTGDLVVVFEIPDEDSKLRCHQRCYNLPPHIAEPHDRTGPAKEIDVKF